MGDGRQVQCRCGEFYDLTRACPACGTSPQVERDRLAADCDSWRMLADSTIARLADAEDERDRLRARLTWLRTAYGRLWLGRAASKTIVEVHQDLWHERDRLRAEAKAERRINEMAGCPDCGVHAGCLKVVVERDRLRVVVGHVVHMMNGVIDTERPGVKGIGIADYEIVMHFLAEIGATDWAGGPLGPVKEGDLLAALLAERDALRTNNKYQTDAADAAAEAVGAMAGKLTAVMAELALTRGERDAEIKLHEVTREVFRSEQYRRDGDDG